MLKTLGIIMIIGSSISFGVGIRKELYGRIKGIQSMMLALNIIENELSYNASSIPDIIKKLARDNTQLYSKVFRELDELIENDDGLSLSYKWMKVFREHGKFIHLAEDDVSLMLDVASVIGRYDASQQIKYITYIENQLTKQYKSAKEDLLSKGKLYKTCSLALGILIVLILF